MDRTRANQNLHTGIGLYKKGLHQESLSLLLPIHSIASREPNSLLFIAQNYRQLKQIQKSTIFFDKLISAHKHPGYFCTYANMLIDEQLYSKAKKLLNESIDIDPNYFDSHYNLGRAKQITGSYEEARDSYLKAFRLNPSHADACLGYGQCLVQMNNRELAISIYQDFLVNFPNTAKVLYSLASLYEEDNKEAAEVALLKCIELSPDNRDYSFEYAKVLQGLGKINNAVSVLITMLEKTPFDHHVHDVLFNLLWLNGMSEPFRYYLLACESDPANSLVIELVKKLIKNDELQLGLRKIEVFLCSSPSYTEALMIKGHLERELGDFQASLKTLKSIHLQDQTLAPALYEEAVTYLCLNQFSDAVRVSKLLLELYPNNQGGRALLATSLKLNGNVKEYGQLYNYQSLIKFIPLSSIIDSNFNQKLKMELDILHKTKNHPIDQSLRKGTQTQGQLFNMNIKLVEELREEIAIEVKTFLNGLSSKDKGVYLQNISESFSFAGSWSVLLRQGGHHQNHFHSEGTFSACYYVEVPDVVNRNGQGWLNLGQPELSRWLNLEPDFCVKPEPGCLIIFPSYMWHGTNPLIEESERTTIAFDIKARA
ncbi:putative 2OG-Fe(II) oxygenase [uncultured Shewanella sp.]|uniref:2OG-Fe(II) oxygenase family protein n=1 Tax=uncultured Shewanella sp. TaxID=173975 RepID=UPI0026056FB4|nr:putative 2OG-Fe(II) oxygenase [uncultured Shewanella sp.]